MKTTRTAHGKVRDAGRVGDRGIPVDHLASSWCGGAVNHFVSGSHRGRPSATFSWPCSSSRSARTCSSRGTSTGRGIELGEASCSSRDAAHTPRGTVFITVGILVGHPAHATGVVVVGRFHGGDPRRPGDRPSWRIASSRGARCRCSWTSAPSPRADIQDAAQAVPGREKSAYGIRSRGPSDLRYAEVGRCASIVHANVGVRGTPSPTRWEGAASRRDLRLARSHGARRAMLSLSGEQGSRTTRRPAAARLQAGISGVPAAAHRGNTRNALTRKQTCWRIGDEAVTRARGERRGAVPPHRSPAARAPSDRIIARRLRLPSFPRWRQKASRAARGGSGAPHALGPSNRMARSSARCAASSPATLAPRGRRPPPFPPALFIAGARRRGFPRRSRPRVRRRRGKPGRHRASSRGRFQALVVTFGQLGFPTLAPRPGDHRSRGALAAGRGAAARTATHCSPSCRCATRPAAFHVGPREPHGERGHPPSPPRRSRLSTAGWGKIVRPPSW